MMHCLNTLRLLIMSFLISPATIDHRLRYSAIKRVLYIHTFPKQAVTRAGIRNVDRLVDKTYCSLFGATNPGFKFNRRHFTFVGLRLTAALILMMYPATETKCLIENNGWIDV